jgi:hypothetical protein
MRLHIETYQSITNKEIIRELEGMILERHLLSIKREESWVKSRNCETRILWESETIPRDIIYSKCWMCSDRSHDSVLITRVHDTIFDVEWWLMDRISDKEEKVIRINSESIRICDEDELDKILSRLWYLPLSVTGKSMLGEMIFPSVSLISPVSESSDDREKMRSLPLPVPLSLLIKVFSVSFFERLEFSSMWGYTDREMIVMKCVEHRISWLSRSLYTNKNSSKEIFEEF